MTQPPSRLALFVLVHYWLVIALALFGLGFLGVSLTASTTLSKEGAISIASGICFFLSVASFAVWLYWLAHRHRALPALRSTNIKELATKKLIVVLATVSFFAFSLFWLFFIAALATPLAAGAAHDPPPHQVAQPDRDEPDLPARRDEDDEPHDGA